MKLAKYVFYSLLIFYIALSLLFIQVRPALCIDSPVVTGTQATEAYENEDYAWKVMINGGTAPYTCNSTGTLPSWLVLDSASNSVYGKPPRGLTTDTVSFGIRVTDSSIPPVSVAANISIPLRYKSTISLTPALSDSQTNVYIDGQVADKTNGANKITKVFSSGTKHTITVDPTVQSTNNTARYTAVSSKIAVSGLLPDANFEYNPEYNIRVRSNTSDLPPLSGSGWYKAGSVVESTALSSFEPKTGTQYRFLYWQLPSGEVSGNQNLSLKVANQGDVVATYDTYYQLTFSTEHCTVDGGGWYKAGSNAKWNVNCAESIPVPGFWGGLGVELKPDTTVGTVVMDGPKEITITWKPDYNRIIVQITFAGIGAIIFIAIGLLHEKIKLLIGRIRGDGY